MVLRRRLAAEGFGDLNRRVDLCTGRGEFAQGGADARQCSQRAGLPGAVADGSELRQRGFRRR